MGIRYFSSSSRKVSPKGWPNEEEFDDEDPFNQQKEEENEQRPIKLTHVNQNGTAHMVAVGNKRPTHRTAFAVSTVRFSKPEPLRLIKQNAIKKGDVLSVARIAGIMAAKQTPTIIPLAAYPFGGVLLTARVETTGRTGVEMDALHAASAAALTVYDMCKAVDKAMSLQNARVVLKTGGKSGDWVDVGWLFARAGVVRSGRLEGLMTTTAGAVDEGVRRAVVEAAEEGEGGGLARREWKKCYRVLTRSGWEPEKAMQLLSWIPRKAYSPAAIENGGAGGG
ncbi:hypothetical protein BFW01_g9892 [Lasiodiplodia theobromae]|nr:hypothetical protein BFW01_g9892 [Lasiodiplodia theobromae]